MIRVRFAPSPTGYLHIGGARTALFNYLFARHYGGSFILRIEDTDRKRFQQDALDDIFNSLRWLQIEWDEGPLQGGKFGPYFQSERLKIYQEMAERLVAEKKAYYCFCSEERLANLRQEHSRESTFTGYDRFCLNLSEDEVQEKLQAGLPHVVRLKIPDSRTIEFQDLIRGQICYQSNLLDDLVLLKSDGYPTYHLANVVDDHLMEISHVMRGDEWISSTPKHIVLYQAFGWQPPLFAHLPIILSPDGGKLSKRKGAASVLDFKQAGFLPQAVVNFLALLGWNPGDDKEIRKLEEIIGLFSLERISPKAAVFDEKKLEWMNGVYLQQIPTAELATLIVPLWQKAGLNPENYAPDYLIQIIELLKVRCKKLTDFVDAALFFFQDPQHYEEKAEKKYFSLQTAGYLKFIAAQAEKLTDFSVIELERVFQEAVAHFNCSAGNLIHPTRLAVSGRSTGPGLFEMLAVLGRGKVLQRIRRAIEYIQNRSQVKDES